jgi:hypothetical protein
MAQFRRCPEFPFLRRVAFKEMSGFCKKLYGILDPRILPFRSSDPCLETRQCSQPAKRQTIWERIHTLQTIP